jgi:exopolyphosphatase / guanosine-5'-triphosphate,3'-diphosphate pyrophosphatase
MERFFAIIDLGSNSVRLVLYRVDENKIVYEIDNIKSVLRLSSRINAAGEIDQTGVEMLLECLKNYKRFCISYDIHQIHGVATAALRSAANREEILERIEQETNIRFRLLEGKEEAYYGYLAIINSMDTKEAITIDMGGGSTELTYFQNRLLKESYSFSFGALSLMQKFGEETDGLRDYVTRKLLTQHWIVGKRCPIIIMGGTARNLARVHQRQNGYSLSILHNYEMNKNQLAQLLDWVKPLSGEQRRTIKGLSKDRVDIFPIGLCVFLSVMEVVGAENLYISTKGLRDGILFEILFKDHPLINLPGILNFSVRQLMNHYKVNVPRSLHVAELTLQLFDGLKNEKLHSMGERERLLLECSSMLHDIGRFIHHIESSKHTFYLIENALLFGVTNRERLIIALIASYKNNRQLHQLANRHSDILTIEDVALSAQLGALLALARSLERHYAKSIQRVSFISAKKSLQIKMMAKEPLYWAWDDPKLQEAMKRAGKAYNISIILTE